MSSTLLTSAAATMVLPEIRGLADYWSLRTGRSLEPAMPEMQARILLDMLGLGLEQTISYLGRESPAYPTFEAWILQTAGAPDPLAIARYHAWLDNAPMPEAVTAQLRTIDAMPDVLDADDLAQWEAQGYVILRQAISADEAKAAETLLWRTVRADPRDPGTWHDSPRNNGIMVQHFQDPALEPARRSARIHKGFAQLWGTADLWASVDRMSFNPPVRPGKGFQGPRLHWDASLSPPIPFATQGILYLTDTTTEQGAFQLVPGFHHGIEDWLAGLGDADPRAVTLDDQAQRIAANAGDLIIWRQDLPHGASANSTDRPRMAQYVTMYSPDLVSQKVWR